MIYYDEYIGMFIKDEYEYDEVYDVEEKSYIYIGDVYE